LTSPSMHPAPTPNPTHTLTPNTQGVRKSVKWPPGPRAHEMQHTK
jgi:hypothetical protein